MFFIHVTSNFNSFIHRLIVSVCPAFWPLRRLHGQNDVRHCAKCFAASTADEALRARGGLETGADVILQWTFCTIASCFHLGTLDQRLHYDMKWKWSFHLETTIASLLFFLLFLKRTFFMIIHIESVFWHLRLVSVLETVLVCFIAVSVQIHCGRWGLRQG